MKKPEKSQYNSILSNRAPDYLGKQAATTWRKIIPFLEAESKIKRIDSGLVEMYCTQYEIYRNAYKHIQEHDNVQAIYHSVQDSSGAIIGKDFVGYRRNPSTQIYSDAIAKLTKIGSELGLSPKSRNDLLKIVDADPDAEETVDDLLNKGGDSF
ncbi:phage terminase small subunit P27 family [Oenococcus sicerae]|uniref:phage terminase small subunit P27 family n=1 Tax=Oenococcus sicerae TaxID=2203724 RepID=UPI0039ECEE82